MQTKVPAVWETAARYQLVHAVALLATAWACERFPGAWTGAAGWLFAAGTVLFSGSLYALVLTGVRGLGAVTPSGCVERWKRATGELRVRPRRRAG